MLNKTIEFQALGTTWWISTKSLLPKADEHRLIGLVRQFENNYSRFLPESYISLLNTSKKIDNSPSELVDLLMVAKNFNKSTNGLFNISVGSWLEQNGYGFSRVGSHAISQRIDQDLTINNDVITIADGIVIDLGGIGKGWLVDKIGKMLVENYDGDFIVNGGGDMYIRSKKPQVVLIENPFESTEAIGEISIRYGGVAASSANRRIWQKDGQLKNHLVNPISQKNINNYAAVHTYAENCTTADVMSTVLFLCEEKVLPQIADVHNVEYLIIRHNGSYFASDNFPAQMY